MCTENYSNYLREHLTMDLNKVVKICALNLMNLVKSILIYFGIAKIFLLLGRLRKLSVQKSPLEDTYPEMAASDEDWSAWKEVIIARLDWNGFKR